MGDMADDAINGANCCWCGVYFREDHGYPVVCDRCWKNSTPKDREGMQKAHIKEAG